VFLHRSFIPGLAIYSYMVGDEASGRCAVIDPTRDVEPYMRLAREQGLRITEILETHVHADFISGAVELKARLPYQARIHCSGLGGTEWTPPYADTVVSHGDEISFGKVRLRALHTPGHTLEHVCWALFDGTRSEDTPWVLFTGDFLFVGDVGRPDLLGPEAQQRLAHELYGSVFERITDLPDFLELFPAHGAGSLCGKAIVSRESSTLGFERRFSPSLRHLPEDEWVATLLRGMPVAPPYFRRMKEVNAAGPRVIGPELPGRKGFSAKEVQERVCVDCLILDVRAKEAFAAAHIPGSINIPFGPHLATWAGWVLPYDRPILAVVDAPEEMTEIVRCLVRVGFDRIEGYLEGGVDAWEGRGYELAGLDAVSVHDLAGRLRSDDRPFVLDVRTEQEWEAGHIEGAHHIHGGLLQDRLGEVPRNREVAVVCGSGYRASIAASFLKRAGYDAVTNVIGGMTAWTNADFSVTK
jgi:hydroxyacylglutathione hydrolase